MRSLSLLTATTTKRSAWLDRWQGQHQPRLAHHWCRRLPQQDPLVGDAYRKLDNAARQYLIYVCQREGIVQNGSSFKLSE